LNWEAIGASGEVVGAIGVIVTLVYLAAQIRQNTKALNAATFQANTELWLDWYLGVAEAGASEAYGRGMTGRADLDARSFQRFFLICRSQFLVFENQYYQYRHGALEEGAFLGYEGIMKSATLAWPGMRAFWQINRHGYSPDFVAYVDGLIEQTRAAAARRAANPAEMIEDWKAALESQP
jgi:hypothetical protein